LLELDGEDFRTKALADRRKKLFKLLRRQCDGIEYVEHLEGDDAVIFEHACKLGLEGILLRGHSSKLVAILAGVPCGGYKSQVAVCVFRRTAIQYLENASKWLEDVND